MSYIYVRNSDNRAIDTHVWNKQLSDSANINVPSELMWLESDSTLVLPTHARTGTTYTSARTYYLLLESSWIRSITTTVYIAV